MSQDAEETKVPCIVSGCDALINPDVDDCNFTDNGVLCWGCYENLMSDCSTVWMLDPEHEPRRVYVTDLFTEDENGEEWPEITRSYVSVNGWNGYHQTKIAGYVEVTGGWTTFWPDETMSRKLALNEWLELLCTGKEIAPFPMAVAYDPTTNVFSTAISVFVAEAHEVAFSAILPQVVADGLR